jgi:hypothetical protein
MPADVGTLKRSPIDLNRSLVMRGLDPRIHPLRRIYQKWMDPRVKAAGDGRRMGECPLLAQLPQ